MRDSPVPERSAGEIVRRRRLAAGLSQEALAGRTGLSPRTLRNIERGNHRPYPDTLRRLSDALGLTPEERDALTVVSSRELPPSRTPQGLRNNLPFQPTPLVGREREVGEVCERLRQDETRLLTLIGPGGTGKTRLALRAAAELLEDFDDGVFFVSLAAITDSNLLFTEIAGALGTPNDGLKEYLGRKEHLLVLDNLEQILSVAPLVGELLSAAPRLKVLATSRVPLGIYGEREYAVPPLAVPDPKHLPGLGALSQYEAVRLFIERAEAVKAGFEVNNENAPAVAEICVRLDGLPLAIELAAARVKLLPPKAILARLANRLGLLTGGARDVPARQCTLRGTIEWSYDLLDEGEKMLFARLAVFSGGRTLQAIETVCNAEGDLPVDALDGVSSLLDKSLLGREETADEEPRFVMLETIHEYARERLRESGKSEKFGRAHKDYFVALAEEAEAELTGPQQTRWMERLGAEHDNLRAALSWSLVAEDSPSALRIGAAVWHFWVVRGNFGEGRRWLEAGLAGKETAPVGIRAGALHGLGELALWQGDYARATQNLEASLTLYREAKDRRGEAFALCFLGWVASDRGDFGRAEGLLGGSLALMRAAGKGRDVGVVLNALAMLELSRGDHGRAAALQEESMLLAREAGDVRSVAIYTHNLGWAAAMAGEHERAEASALVAHELLQEVGDRAVGAANAGLLGFLALSRNDADRAEELCAGAIQISQEIAQTSDVVHALDLLAGVAAAKGETRKAARIWGATAGFREDTGTLWVPQERGLIEPHLAAARVQLDVATWRKEWEKGGSMTLDRAVEYALCEGDSPPAEQEPLPSSPGPEPLAGLTPREAEVLSLVARGLTNPQAAKELFLSPRTVQRHLNSVYRKLGVRSRAAATRFAAEHGLL